jgi:hypothetical protein
VTHDMFLPMRERERELVRLNQTGLSIRHRLSRSIFFWFFFFVFPSFVIKQEKKKKIIKAIHPHRVSVCVCVCGGVRPRMEESGIELHHHPVWTAIVFPIDCVYTNTKR